MLNVNCQNCTSEELTTIADLITQIKFKVQVQVQNLKLKLKEFK